MSELHELLFRSDTIENIKNIININNIKNIFDYKYTFQLIEPKQFFDSKGNIETYTHIVIIKISKKKVKIYRAKNDERDYECFCGLPLDVNINDNIVSAINTFSYPEYETKEQNKFKKKEQIIDFQFKKSEKKNRTFETDLEKYLLENNKTIVRVAPIISIV